MLCGLPSSIVYDNSIDTQRAFLSECVSMDSTYFEVIKATAVYTYSSSVHTLAVCTINYS